MKWAVFLFIALLFVSGCSSLQCPESCDDGNPCTMDFCSEETAYVCTSTRDSSCCVSDSDCLGLGADYVCRDYACFQASPAELRMKVVMPWYSDYASLVSDFDSRYAKGGEEYVSSFSQSDIVKLNIVYESLNALVLPKNFSLWKEHMNRSVSYRIYSVEAVLKAAGLSVPQGDSGDIAAAIPAMLQYRESMRQYANASDFYREESKKEIFSAMGSLMGP